VPVGIQLLLAGLPEMTENLLWVHWCGESRAAESCGQCERLVALELHDAGGVADGVGRAKLMVEVAHRDSVRHVNAISFSFLSYGRSRTWQLCSKLTHHHGLLPTTNLKLIGAAARRQQCQVACEGHPLILDDPIRVWRANICWLPGTRNEEDGR
jgi:hypothetical protein